MLGYYYINKGYCENLKNIEQIHGLILNSYEFYD